MILDEIITLDLRTPCKIVQFVDWPFVNPVCNIYLLFVFNFYLFYMFSQIVVRKIRILRWCVIQNSKFFGRVIILIEKSHNNRLHLSTWNITRLFLTKVELFFLECNIKCEMRKANYNKKKQKLSWWSCIRKLKYQFKYLNPSRTSQECTHANWYDRFTVEPCSNEDLWQPWILP